MIHDQLKLISPTLRRTAGRVVCWTTIDMVLGTVWGALFGGVFGGFGMLIRFEPSQIVSIAAFFAVCGAAAGALVGMCGGLFDDVEKPEPTCSPSTSTALELPVVPASQTAMTTPRRFQNRVVGLVGHDRQREQAVSSGNPSLN